MLRQRYRRILWFFAGVILSIIWWDLFLPRVGLRSLSRRTRPERLRRKARSFRLLAVRMGGVMIKVGQFLSARLDILPLDVTDELAGLQDEVRAEPFEAIQHVVEGELNGHLEDVFSFFDKTPLASASIGQVHRARLRTQSGQSELPPVVVKVQRPDIRQIVEVDLAALRVVGSWIWRYPPIHRRANIPDLLEEFSRSLYEEIDYRLEGDHAETFAANFQNDPGVCVPRVYWTATTTCMLTLEDVWSIKITDYAAIEAAGINRKEIAQRLFNTYLKQIFEDQFFHADPHPGNLFVFPSSPATESQTMGWKLVFVDFGMVGQITPRLFDGLRELLIAIGTRDARRIVRAYQLLGILLPGADVETLEKAGERIFERFWGKSTTEMVQLQHSEAVAFAQEFGNLLYELPFQVPENLILLGRCVGILSGICTGLDPDFNVWTSLAPYASRIIAAESGSRLEPILAEIGRFVRVLVSLPLRADNLLDRLEQGRLAVRVPEVSDQIADLTAAVRKLAGAILLAAFLLGAVQLYLAHQVFYAGGLGIAAIITMIWLILGR